jgi:hypothetical protein
LESQPLIFSKINVILIFKNECMVDNTLDLLLWTFTGEDPSSFYCCSLAPWSHLVTLSCWYILVVFLHRHKPKYINFWKIDRQNNKMMWLIFFFNCVCVSKYFLFIFVSMLEFLSRDVNLYLVTDYPWR